MASKNKVGHKNEEEIFLQSEGDAYFLRNFDEQAEAARLASDKILGIHLSLELAAPKKMLEIGCMTGYRCEAFRREYSCGSYGVEPSAKAIEEGRKRYPEINLEIGVISSLPFSDIKFDVIVLGNFLYWIDRESLFIAAAQVDALLNEGGFLYVIDFDSPIPHKNTYSHNSHIFTHKMKHYSMFSWNPAYSVIYQAYMYTDAYKFKKDGNDISQVTVLRKDTDKAYQLTDCFS